MSASDERHRYVPDAMTMGDCRVCGHVADAPRHVTERNDWEADAAALADVVRWLRDDYGPNLSEEEWAAADDALRAHDEMVER